MHILLRVSSLLVLSLSLMACNSNGMSTPNVPTPQGPTPQGPSAPKKSDPIGTEGAVALPDSVQPINTPVASSAYEPNNSWKTAALLSYDVASSQASISSSESAPDVDWYKFEGKKGDSLEILVRTQSQYVGSKLDSGLELYPPIFAQLRWDLTGPLAANDDASLLNDGDFGSRISYILTADATYYLKVSNVRVTSSSNGNDSANVYDLLVRKIVAQ